MADTLLTSDGEVLDADIAARVELAFNAETSQYAVEQGVDLSDHLRISPLTIDIVFVISENPLITPRFSGTNLRNRARAFVERLRRAQSRAELFQLRSDVLGQFDNLACTSIREIREGGLRGLELPVSFTQIRVAEARSVVIEVPKQSRGRRRVDRGTQPTKQETDEPKRQSLLSQLSGYGLSVD